MEIEVSDHAVERGKQRIGLNKKAMQRQGQLAWERGIRHSEIKGRLKKWVDKEALRYSNHKASHYILYNNHLFFFHKISEEKVTVSSMIKIPTNIATHLKSYIK